MLDARVRQALYMAIDKETWAVAILSGNRDMVSRSLLPPDHSLYDRTALEEARECWGGVCE